MVDVQDRDGFRCDLVEQFVWILNEQYDVDARMLFDLGRALWLPCEAPLDRAEALLKRQV